MNYIPVPLIALLSLVLFAGCATPKYNYTPQARRISEPPLDTITTVQVGEEMARQGTVTEHDAIRVAAPLKVGTLGYTLTPGFFKKSGEDTESEYYLPYAGPDSGSIDKTAITDPWKAIEFSKKENKIGVITIMNLHVMVDAIGVARLKKAFAADDSFQQTLIYSGKVGNRVRLGYREFSNSIARPAFNNDVEYDLDQSKILGYKGARIEVIEATNDHITYKLLQNFKILE